MSAAARPRVAALMRELDRSQWLAPEEIAAGQRQRLAALAAHCAAHSPGFSQRLAADRLEAADLGCEGGLERLAPMTRRTLQHDLESLACRALPEGHGPTGIAQTSGATGEPVTVRKTAQGSLYWLAMTLRYQLWQEPDFKGRLCAIRAGVGAPVRGASWGTPYDSLFETGPSLGLDNSTDLGRQIEEVRAFRPTTLMIYPSNLAAMLDRLDEEGIDLPGLERVRTVGETLSPELRAAAAARLGVKVMDCYSAQEVGYVAIECAEGGLYHVMAETLMVELVDDQGGPCREGEIGRLLVTDLGNYATPMIRYAIGDHAERGPACACGRGLPTLRRIFGRERNMVKLPDGRTHWPITGFRRFREIAPVVQYQLVQRSLDRIEVRLVVEAPLSGDQERALSALIQANLGHPFTLDFRYFERAIPLGRGGKFEEFLRLF